MSDNESLNSGIVMNAQRPNPDPKLHTMLSSLRDANNSRINVLAKGITLKNLKQVSYHKWENGNLISKSRYFPKGKPAPSVIEDGFRIGKLEWWKDKGKKADSEKDILTHRADDSRPYLAHILANLEFTGGPVPVGIFRSVEKPTYDSLIETQIEDAITEHGVGNLKKLLRSGETWVVE